MIRDLVARLSRLSPAASWGGVALVGLWVLYTLIFIFTEATPVSRAALVAAANVLPLAVATFLAWRVIPIVARAALPRRILGHLFLGSAFSFGWYGLVVLTLAFIRALETGEFRLVGFQGPALTWQTLQGLCLYAVVSVLSTVRWTTTRANEAGSTGVESYLLKIEDAMIPVRVAEIVSLQGAHDYVQITTVRGTHLVRHGLSEFSAKLDPRRFFRIHRSILVNLDHVSKVEAIGAGKFRVLMSNGSSHASSRAGAQVLRAVIL